MPLLKTPRSYWGRSLVYVSLLFFILWEWLRPLDATTDTLRTDVGYGQRGRHDDCHARRTRHIGVLLFINYLVLPLFVKVLLKMLFFLFIIYQLYFIPDFPLISNLWLKEVWMDIKLNVDFSLNGQWDFTTQISRTTLFFVVIWAFTTLAFRLVIIRQKSLTVLLVTELYLTALETFTAYDAKWAIVRTLVFGLMLLSLMNLSVIERMTNVSSRRSTWPRSWVVATLIIVLLVSTVGFVSPKAEASWPDPITWVTNVGKGKMIQRIGYGEDDSYLGGPFIMDDQLIFQAKTTQPLYWRGESKDFYDGHGWVSTIDNRRMIPLSDSLPNELYDASLETKAGTQFLNFDKITYSTLFHSGEVNRVNHALPVTDGINYSADFSRLQTEQSTKLDSYELQVDFPVFYREDLLASLPEYSEEIVGRYLETPAELPDRVRELALEITKDKDTPWEKALAIESYLKYGDYTYETTDVAIPGKNDDYVDQFLFDTLKGYCDNFSSSMVIMLRALDIPARWVKGFNSGDYTLDTQTGLYNVEVRSLNAHSWPEVYFSGIGWVPFEPTPSFSSPVVIEDRPDEEQDIAIPALESDERFNRALEDLELEKDIQFGPNGGSSLSEVNKWVVASVIATIILVFAVLLYLFRFTLWMILLERSKKKGKEDSVIFTLFDRIFHMLERKGGERLPHQTIREYVLGVERFRPSHAGQMREFTKLFEGFRYGQGDKKEWENVWIRARMIWKDVATRFRS